MRNAITDKQKQFLLTSDLLDELSRDEATRIIATLHNRQRLGRDHSAMLKYNYGQQLSLV